MISTISNLLKGNAQNHILPFFWQHGEEENVLREYMKVIHESNIGAVCVESRPHPDFCGEKWWKDMDVILDEAQKRDMKIWILDDSHFPTGYANGALEHAPEEVCRQGICYEGRTIKGKGNSISLDITKFLKKKNTKHSFLDIVTGIGKKTRVFSGDILLSAVAVCMEHPGKEVDLLPHITNGKLHWNVPKGTWRIGLCKLSRNCGTHRNYINMMNPDSCRILIDAVYEPHWEHYKEYFGNTIAGFFSDEPELGNGIMYSNEPLGADQDLPWSHTLEPALAERLGAEWKNCMPYLWDSMLDPKKTAQVRFIYMDVVTQAVKSAFSEQIGDWCRLHGVEYIGHMVEDNNNHARTGGSLGHYFRGLAGQDMAGIDDIGGQVIPQGEDKPNTFMHFTKRDGEFYHYILGKLGPSLAAIDSKKRGRTMCEIFGNYGWSEGLRLERFLADHFMVNGINYFVPHAFSPKKFPDPDCPPHFYAHGHNPQYKHFKSLMGYINRVCSLINGGSHVSPVAMLYHGEAEWTGEAMLMQKPARKLLDAQINFDIIPTDVFRDKEYYHTDLSQEFRVNTQIYRAFVIPYAQFVSATLVDAIQTLNSLNVPVIFLERFPDGCYDDEVNLAPMLKRCKVISLDNFIDYLQEKGLTEILLKPEDNRIRYLHYEKEIDLYYFINEGTKKYRGTIILPQTGPLYAYHAWDNILEEVDHEEINESCHVQLELEPYQSCILVFDDADKNLLRKPLQDIVKGGQEIAFCNKWLRKICDSISYPHFSFQKEIVLPDNLEKEFPQFSGWVRYENQFELSSQKHTVLMITDAYEGVEVFINGISAGIQVTPTYRFDITHLIQPGLNDVAIEVSTTLERERASAKNKSIQERLMMKKELAPIGITGQIRVFVEKTEKYKEE